MAVAARYPLLTAEDEIQLGRLIRQWLDWDGGESAAPVAVQRQGRRALDRFLLSNLRLAHFVARRFSNRGVAMDDLTQAATEGLITACRRFKPALGYRFSSYAIWWAQQSCQVIVAQQGNGIRLPTAVSEQLRKVTRTEERLRRELGQAPSDTEIETAAGLKPGQLADLRFCARRCDTRSLDELCSRSDNSPARASSWLSLLAGDDAPAADLEAQEIKSDLRQLIDSPGTPLTPQQRHILQCRYLQDDPPSIARLASRLNMNRETLRRMERRALQILRLQLPGRIGDYLPQS